MVGWEAMEGEEKAAECLENKSARLEPCSLFPVSRSRRHFTWSPPLLGPPDLSRFAGASAGSRLWITHPALSLHLDIVVVGASGRLISAPIVRASHSRFCVFVQSRRESFGSFSRHPNGRRCRSAVCLEKQEPSEKRQ